MKCVRDGKTGLVVRVSDEAAKQAVDSGKAVYVSKNVWRTEVRDKDKISQEAPVEKVKKPRKTTKVKKETPVVEEKPKKRTRTKKAA